jgi:hypothetical protein
MGGGRRSPVPLAMPWTPAYAGVTDRVREGSAFCDRLTRSRKGTTPVFKGHMVSVLCVTPAKAGVHGRLQTLNGLAGRAMDPSLRWGDGRRGGG